MRVIERYVTDLDRALAGPGRVKRDLLAEARDGLVDAATAYGADGMPAAEAQRLAVRDFGGVRDVAPAYQAELAALAAQRFSLRLATALIVMGGASNLMWRGAPWADAPIPSPAYALLSATVDRLGVLLAVGALAAYAWLTWGARRGRTAPGRAARWVACGGLAGVVAVTAGGFGMYAYTVSRTEAALTWPPMVVGGLLTAGVLTWLGGGAARCLRWAGRVPAGAASPRSSVAGMPASGLVRAGGAGQPGRGSPRPSR